MNIVSAKSNELLQFNPGKFAQEVLNLNRNAYRCRFSKSGSISSQYKSQTISAGEMLAGVINSCLLGNNFSQSCSSFASSLLPAKKSAMYEFMKSPKANWNKMLMLTAWEVHKHLASLTPRKEHSLIIDDSVLEHSGAKSMELVTRTYDHNLGSTVKGFTCLQIGWTDSRSYFTIDSRLVASDESKAKSKACPKQKCKCFDHRLHGGVIRNEASLSKPELVKQIVLKAQRHGFDFAYVLMDSWFTYGSLLKWFKSKINIDIIGMLKMDSRKYHRIDRLGRSVTYNSLDRLWQSFKHKRNKDNSSIAGCEIVRACTGKEKFEDGIDLKIVYLRNYSDPNKSLVLASTDLKLSPEKIVRLYAGRWMIETGFFNQKEFFGLGKETRSVDFDNQNAFMCLSAIRATILEFHRRLHRDVRTMGEIARDCQETMRLIPLAEAVKELFDRLIEFPDKLDAKGCIVKGKLRIVKHMLKMLLCNWYHDMIDYVKAIFDFCPKQIKKSGTLKKWLT